MEESVIAVLQSAPLFRGLTKEELIRIQTENYIKVCQYKKGSVIFSQGEKPERLHILISGAVGVSKNTFSGKRIMITTIEHPGETFGEIYLFMEKQQYEVQAETLEASVVLEVKHEVFRESSGRGNPMEEKLKNNLMTIFARKAYGLNHKVRVLGCTSIREKIAVFLTERQGENGEVTGTPSREEMADYLSVTRPSLSRELGNMVREGILSIEGRNIRILDQEALEEYL